jgi:ATP-dependent DNA helicase RecQ
VTGQKILSCVVRLREGFGARYTTSVLMGSKSEMVLRNGHDRLSTWGILSGNSERVVRDWTEQLLSQGYLEKDGPYSILRVTPRGWNVIRGQETPKLLKPAERSKKERIAQKAGKSRMDLKSWDGVNRELFEDLRRLRLELAQEKGVPAYVVMSDATLRDLARRRPSGREGFLETYGIGERKCAEYGEVFLQAIRRFCEENRLEMNLQGT